MTRQDIIRMAHLCDLGRVVGPLDSLLDHEWEDLHRFAGLVAAQEREACAEEAYSYLDDPVLSGMGYATGCANAIRARQSL